MTSSYFKRLNFENYKKSLDLKATIEEDWVKQSNGVLIKPLISEEESIRRNITYMGLIFSQPTDGHKYKKQTDTIHFIDSGAIEFSEDEFSGRRPIPFRAGDTIQIPPPIIRKLIPYASRGGKLTIELIVQPRFDPKDGIHVYD